MNIEITKDGYILHGYNMVQYEPYIPYRRETNGVTDYQLSAEAHLRAMKEAEANPTPTPRPLEEEIAELKVKNEELNNAFNELLTVILPSLMGE